MPPQSRPTTAFADLTVVDVRILKGLASYRSEKAIAEVTHIPLPTVKNRVARLKSITGCSTAPELGAWWRLWFDDWTAWITAESRPDDEVVA